MAIQSFSVGQVLTAAQVNALQANDYNQTVSNKTASYTLVAADKGTRITMSSTSATTITVNDSLFSAGDTLFIQNLNTGVSTITAGTATVTTSASLALAQWEGGTLYFTSASAAIFFKSDGAAAGGGGMTLLSTTTLSGASTTISGIDQTYNTLMFVCFDLTPSSQSGLKFEPNGSATLGDTVYTIAEAASRSNWSITAEVIYMLGSADNTANNSNNASVFTIFNYASATASVKNFSIASRGITGGSSIKTMVMGAGGIITSSAITSMKIGANTGNLTGTVLMYGVK
jgi:hypothetical protein